jgi:membrane protein required for beta-lactamase induction
MHYMHAWLAIDRALSQPGPLALTLYRVRALRVARRRALPRSTLYMRIDQPVAAVAEWLAWVLCIA